LKSARNFFRLFNESGYIKPFGNVTGDNIHGPEAIGWRQAAPSASSGVTDEIWKQYIEDQKPEEPDNNFKVV
jgi:hypothetical protein